MANVMQKSIKYPGLSDTYTFVQLDDTLAVAGKAADAKATGDALALKLTASDIDNTLSVSGKAADAKAAGDAISAVRTKATAIETAVATQAGAIDTVLVPDFGETTQNYRTFYKSGNTLYIKPSAADSGNQLIVTVTGTEVNAQSVTPTPYVPDTDNLVPISLCNQLKIKVTNKPSPSTDPSRVSMRFYNVSGSTVTALGTNDIDIDSAVGTWATTTLSIPSGATHFVIYLYTRSYKGWPDTYTAIEFAFETATMANKRANPLYGKKIAFDGDSICAPNSTNDPQGGWAGRTASNNRMVYKNYGVGGATITHGTQNSGVDRHWIVDSLDTIHTEMPNLDYYIFEGGTNDADLNVTLGTVSATDFTGEYDTETFCGAFETILYNAQTYFPNAKIGYIVAMKMGTSSSVQAARYAYFTKAMEICTKWGVPYLNLWDTCRMNPNLDSGNVKYVDGQHPTPAGYELMQNQIETWIASL